MRFMKVIESPAYPVDASPRLQVIHEQITDSQGSDSPQDIEKVLPLSLRTSPTVRVILLLPNLLPKKRLRSALEPWTDLEGEDINVTESSSAGLANESRATKNFCWISTISERFPNARILTYRYNGAPEDVVAGLMQDLVRDRNAAKNRDQQNRTEVPILLIGCSFGGLLAKQLYIASAPGQHSNEGYAQLHCQIKAFLFLGTHNIGTPKLLTFSWPMSFFIRQYFPAPYYKALEDTTRNEWLFRRHGGWNIPIFCYYETQETRAGPWGLANMGVLVPRENACIPGKNRGVIEANHRRIGIFVSRNDPSYTRVMNTIGDLIKQIGNLAALPVAQKAPWAVVPATGVKALALDGGGVRGLFTALVLERIMDEVRQLDKLSIVPRPCEYFSLIGGTSTGGLLGLMLGRLEMDATSCVREYKSLSKVIFQKRHLIPGKNLWDAWWGRPWFSGDVLKTAVRDLIAQRISIFERDQLEAGGKDPGDAPLRSPQTLQANSFLCATADSKNVCERLRTYDFQPEVSQATECAIWEAARATSAAPIYFPAMEINGQKYFDGGMRRNNQIIEVIREIHLLYGEHAKIRVVVSIGTGRTEPSSMGRGILGFMKQVIWATTDTEKDHQECLSIYPKLPYYRLNSGEDLAKIDLADYSKIGIVEMRAKEYIRSEEGSTLIKECARWLANTQE